MPKAVSNYSTSNGSDGFISGVPSIISFYEDLVENADKYLEDAVSKIAPVYENYLRDQAKDRGWEDSYTSITVSYDPANRQLNLTGDPMKEYGDGRQPPRPVIRSAVSDLQDLENAVNQQIERTLL
jgi:hypothetical protein